MWPNLKTFSSLGNLIIECPSPTKHWAFAFGVTWQLTRLANWQQVQVEADQAGARETNCQANWQQDMAGQMGEQLSWFAGM